MRYDFCPKCGTKYYEQKEANKFVCSNCAYELYLNSKATASALIVDGDKILLGKRLAEPEKGKWDVVGGFLNYGEHPEAAVKREVKEETGLDVKIEQLTGIFTDEYGSEKHATLNIFYLVKVVGGAEQPGDDIGELKWFSKNEIPNDLAFKNNRDGINAWLKEKH